ncbi:MAG: histidine kinase [Gemmatimonas sp. SG8_28]|nr:MAG: histidine kinase [Gemmatimonas sp. SG8_28]
MVSADALVYVVDDDPAVLDAIRLLLRSVGLRSQTFESAAAFLDAFDRDQHGCLVLDVRMPSMSGIDLQEKLQEIGATIPIVFVTAHGDIPMAVQAVKAGALDFIPKPFRDQDLLDRVQQAIAIDTQQRREQEEKLSVSARYNALSPREREVLELVVAGKANKVIAADLGISQRTVEIHRARVMQKMGADSLPDLVRLTIELDEVTDA